MIFACTAAALNSIFIDICEARYILKVLIFSAMCHILNLTPTVDVVM